MDISTKTSSTMTTTETNISTQTQRNTKSDVSFLDEMNKFANENIQPETTENSENNKTKASGKANKNEINIISHNRTIDNITNTNRPINDIPQNINLKNNYNTQGTIDKEMSVIDIDIKNNTDINKPSKEITTNKKTHRNTSKNTNTNVKNYDLTDNKEQLNETNSLISEQTPQKVFEHKNHKNSIKNNAEKIINTIKTEAIEEQIDKINNTPVENITIEAAAIAAQTTVAIQNTVATAQNSDNIQTLIEANKQLADIALIADAKIADIKIIEKTTNKEAIKVDYTTVKMSTDDAAFFAELVQDTEKTLQNVVANLQSEVEQKIQETSKNVKVSATLMNAISEAVKTNQPMRIDFDKDISIIIKIDKDGSINAKFIPGDKAVEEYLKQNISALRQRFDEQEINYRDLSYSNRQKQNQENNRRNNKEKDHE